MRKWSALLVLAVMCLSVTGCFGNDETNMGTTNESVTENVTESVTQSQRETETYSQQESTTDVTQTGTEEATSEGIIEEIATDVSQGIENIGNGNEDPNKNVNEVTRGR